MAVIPKSMMDRAGRCVCKFCGGKIEPAVIVYNRYGGNGLELYCGHCGKSDDGVERELYLWAERFVRESGFDYFTEIADETDKREKNIARVCMLLSWYLRKKGLLTDDGYHPDMLRAVQLWEKECEPEC